MSSQQGLSGLNAISKSLEVIGNNVANVGTYGAKVSRAEFSDLYAASSAASATAAGIGVTMAAITQQFSQGNVTTTSNPLDLAINGQGFFQMTDEQSPVSYTRNGQFKVDRDGFVVNNQGLKLMGYPVNATGQIQSGTAEPLRLPTAGISPKNTSGVTLELNLDSRAAVTLPAAGDPITLTDPSTYNNATSLSVFDVKGQPVAVTYYFQKAAADTWNVYVTANGNPLQGTAATPARSFGIQFASNGGSPQFLDPATGALSATPPTLNIPATTSVTGATTEAIPGIEMSLSNLTQFGAVFGVTNQTQDGYAPGQMVGIQFESNGIITARYSNGQTKSAGQVEIANFRNVQGLQPIGGNGWTASYKSGEPINGVPGAGSFGALQAGALEESNIDLTAELVNMMSAQRSYQANAQTIRTQDQVLQTLVNLR